MVAAILILCGYYLKLNNAQQLEMPFRNKLISQGATFVCGYGDTGKGVSNKYPWYKAYYQLPKSRDQAINSVDRIAAELGYKIKQATLNERGPITVSDEFINEWFYDIKKNNHTFIDIEEGEVGLYINVLNRPLELSSYHCDKSNKLIFNEATTPVIIRVSLPKFKF